MTGDIKRERALKVLGLLRSNLDLSSEDLATMLGLTGETVHAWETGTAEVPDLVLGKLIAANSALDRLLEMFLPRRLPQVIRRRAAAFEGERALDWILDGRIGDVAEKYAEGLAYLKKPA